MPEITSPSNNKIKQLLKVNKEAGSTLFIEGLHLIAIAFAKGLVLELFTTTSLPFAAPSTKISDNVARKLTSKVTTDGHFALIKKPQLALDFTKPLLYLDEINDPGNMGTVMRTALAFNFGGVIARPNSVDFFNEKVLSAAQGAHFLLPLLVAEPAYLDALKTKGYQILVTDVVDGKRIERVKKAQSVIVLGNEARGVSAEVQARATHIITIPIQNIESLNVAIAGALLMYELSK